MYVVFETLQISIIEKYFSYVQDHKILRAGSENLQDTTCKVNPSIINYEIWKACSKNPLDGTCKVLSQSIHYFPVYSHLKQIIYLFYKKCQYCSQLLQIF